MGIGPRLFWLKLSHVRGPLFVPNYVKKPIYWPKYASKSGGGEANPHAPPLSNPGSSPKIIYLFSVYALFFKGQVFLLANSGFSIPYFYLLKCNAKERK